MVASHPTPQSYLEAAPILRPVTNYRGHSIFAGSQGTEKSTVSPDRGERRIKKEGTEGEDVGYKV